MVADGFSMMKQRVRAIGLVCSALIGIQPAFAEEKASPRVEFPASSFEPYGELSGFASIIGGRVMGGATDATAAYARCRQPCYIADWTNGGVYDRSLSLAPESKIGVQGSYSFTPNLSVTAQVTSRGIDSRPKLEWGYVSAKFGQWDLQLGRKRIPLYFYSDFQDVGIAYPWVSPPPDLYGWEAKNYNGASLRYRGSMQGVGVSGSVYAGSEHAKDVGLYKIYEFEPVDIDWTSMIGADFELNKDWWTVRVSAARNDLREFYRGSGEVFGLKVRTFGLVFNADFGDWLFISEAGESSRKFTEGSTQFLTVRSLMGAVGYRNGNWTPMLTVSRFHEYAVSAGYEPDRWNTYSLGLRYDLTARQALKLQYSRTDDTTGHFTGNTSVLRVGYDLQF